FLSNIAWQAALAIPILQTSFNSATSNVHSPITISSAVYSEIPLFNAERKGAREGAVERVQLSLLGAAGKGGIKGAIGLSQRPSIEMQATAPPWDVKVGAVVRGTRFLIKEFRDCGIPVGQVELEPNAKTYTYVGGGGVGFGVAGSLDLKLALFNG